MRTMLERLARNSRVRRRLPNGAFIWVSPDSQLKYLKPLGGDELLRLASDHIHSGSVVWDIGANCGIFTFGCLAANEVVAVEADPFLCDLLQRSVASNKSLNIKVVAGAASDMNGLAEFAIAARGRASNHLVSAEGRTQAGGERARLFVPTITLDGMLEHLTPPTFVKIDVEGAEAAVLRGAQALLRLHKPTLYIEVGKAHEAECKHLLNSAGYEVSGDFNWLAVSRNRTNH